MFQKKVLDCAKILPGFAAALLIALLARWLESLLPIHLIGASVIALFIGMLINAFLKPNALLQKGLKFTSKKILKFAIILLGASLSIGTILTVGKMSLVVMCFTLLTCFGGGVSGRACAGAQLEALKPDQRRYGYLRRFRNCGDCACDRRGGHGYCLRDERDVSLRYGDDRSFFFFPSWDVGWGSPTWRTASGRARP